MTYEQNVTRRVNLQLSIDEAEITRRRLLGLTGNSILLETERAAINRCLGAVQAVVDRLQRELDTSEALAATEDPEAGS
jgi:hypothetical protein